ncbi:hypothetical protein ACTOS9_21840 (plasmid) [Bacillus subtilis]|uniref:Uncharacterized protein n=1 Tax=Bacillus subtilis TaxID=1423 RepID=A0A8I1WIJ0_BACIU|nr:hypothetical protein [Bacillus subtilis]MBO3796458.1 hypothetical protein [Bacillus subtilis]WEY82946.1 hypothetical protein P5633_00070 [Bacillus subtilis]WGD64181.1 hypothetical protein P5648_22145 [Bacillus subtilis]WGD72631.1 hypothetical protein P5645_22170 [Bacillus subtilis]WGD74632.1 hypothetical protein P5631_00250 [Bacillus subtilis]
MSENKERKPTYEEALEELNRFKELEEMYKIAEMLKNLKETTALNIKFENELILVIHQYMADARESNRAHAIRNLIREALHQKGYLQNA